TVSPIGRFSTTTRSQQVSCANPIPAFRADSRTPETCLSASGEDQRKYCNKRSSAGPSHFSTTENQSRRYCSSRKTQQAIKASPSPPAASRALSSRESLSLNDFKRSRIGRS